MKRRKTPPNVKKILIKILNNNDPQWVHFCRVEKRLYRQYKAVFSPSECLYINSHLSRWLKNDFAVDMQIYTRKDLALMRNLVKTWYQRNYPELYLSNCTTTDENRIHGVVNVWVTQHMKEDLEIMLRKDEELNYDNCC